MKKRPYIASTIFADSKHPDPPPGYGWVIDDDGNFVIDYAYRRILAPNV